MLPLVPHQPKDDKFRMTSSRVLRQRTYSLPRTSSSIGHEQNSPIGCDPPTSDCSLSVSQCQSSVWKEVKGHLDRDTLMKGLTSLMSPSKSAIIDNTCKEKESRKENNIRDEGESEPSEALTETEEPKGEVEERKHILKQDQDSDSLVQSVISSQGVANGVLTSFIPAKREIENDVHHRREQAVSVPQPAVVEITQEKFRGKSTESTPDKELSIEAQLDQIIAFRQSREQEQLVAMELRQHMSQVQSSEEMLESRVRQRGEDYQSQLEHAATPLPPQVWAGLVGEKMKEWKQHCLG